MHQLDRGLDLTCIERAVGGPQEQLSLGHAANLLGAEESNRRTPLRD
jgi:hypothetical protein